MKTNSIRRVVDRVVLEGAPEVQALGGDIRYLNQLRMRYGPGAPLSDVIAREKVRLEGQS